MIINIIIIIGKWWDRCYIIYLNNPTILFDW